MSCDAGWKNARWKKLPPVEVGAEGEKKATDGLVLKTKKKLIWLGIEAEAEVKLAELEATLILMIAPNFLP